ncbi:hypothetical protein DFH09DRAFT_1389875, partial [Mycena vulgaris]
HRSPNHHLPTTDTVPHRRRRRIALRTEFITARQIASKPLSFPLHTAAAQTLNTMSALDARLDALDRRLDSIQREVALNGNMEKGTGYKHPYAEVLFVDGSRPSVAVPALPALLNVDAIRNLTEAEAAQYLLGFGLAPIETFIDRKNRIAEHVGCLVDLCLQLPTLSKCASSG